MPLLERFDVADPAAAHSFIEGISLPEITPVARERMSAETGGAPPVYQEGENQAVAIGSQIAEFAADIPAVLRPQIANSFLLAQLAANRAVETAGGSAWYRAYLEVLANTGWIIERDETSERKMSDVSGEVHKEIIPLLTVLLGPGVAAAAMVTAVLEGLSNIDKDRPWITLFDRESRRASANQFQISHAAATDGTALQVRLACLELEAVKTLTQVLFFKSSDTQAVLRGFGASLSLNAPVFERNKALIEDKVAEYVAEYIRGIEL
ncbi:hypothetical protein [Paracoccus niistensis]|uniref:Uncharacterized protein n=1 Tax=Paracoccus niistensis TaxID=632935 RepID=A0ABV6HZG6_9RHOB